MATTKWVLEPSHSEVEFKVKHMMIATVTGRFTGFNGTVETEDNDFSTANINFSVDAGTVTTNNEQRDGHLKTADFFDLENHPQLTFSADGMTKVDDENYKLSGNLTMRGVTLPLSLNAEFGGLGKDPWGNIRAGFSVSGKLNRKDFGLVWNAPLEAAGGMLVSDEVKIVANVQFVKG